MARGGLAGAVRAAAALFLLNAAVGGAIGIGSVPPRGVHRNLRLRGGAADAAGLAAPVAGASKAAARGVKKSKSKDSVAPPPPAVEKEVAGAESAPPSAPSLMSWVRSGRAWKTGETGAAQPASQTPPSLPTAPSVEESSVKESLETDPVEKGVGAPLPPDDVKEEPQVVEKVPQPGGTVKVVLRFRTNYKTRFGENMVIVGSLAEFGEVKELSSTAVRIAASQGKGARMQYISDDDWGLDMAVELDPTMVPPPSVSYRYVVVDDNGSHPPLPEGGARAGRSLTLAGSLADYPAVMEVRDFWKSPSSADQLMLSAAFTDVIFNDPARASKKTPRALAGGQLGNSDSLIIRLTLQNARVERGHVMGVIGSCSSLGNWEDGKVTAMSGVNFPMWEVDLEVPISQMPVEYRYVILDEKTQKVLAVEQGDRAHRVEANPETLNDSLKAMQISDAGGKQSQRNMVIVNDDTDSSVSSNPLFKSQWRGAGVAVPVFGLRSDKGMGVGEFYDLRAMVDWCVKSGFKLLQLLPVTDTVSHAPATPQDSYPYSSISVYALHPQYLRLSEVEGLSAGLKAEIDKKVQEFNDPHYYKEKQWDADLHVELNNPVDFPNVMNTKLELLRKMFAENGAKTFESAGYKQFLAQAEFWLRPYGLFCYFRDLFGTANPDLWGSLGTGQVWPEKLQKLTSEDSDFYKGVSFYYYVQYLLHVQLLDVSKYAAEKGVVLKGDLPIGIDHDSVDAWYTPHLFNMHKKTGAPPDDYAEMGQNWGFPTYNWNKMREDGYGWWRQRLGWMANYFQAYRIDHILGFFRIWEMPASATGGLLGKFSPALPITRDELRGEGLENLIDRLCEPYLRQHVVEKFFGHDWGRIKERYLDDVGGGNYKFKAGLNSEVELTAIVEREGSCIGYKNKDELLYGLKMLVNNVVLIRDDERPHDAFHPRIEVWKTSSFQELNGDAQHKLRGLYQNYFYGRQDQYWADTAMDKLPPLLDSSNMMVCGEDLGMIPACVKGVLEGLVIMGLKIQRMPAPGESDGPYGYPDRYPHLSVCTPSCHDMSTVAGWWDSLDGNAKNQFWGHWLQRGDGAPQKITPEISDMVLKQHLWSPSCWAVFPIQDVMAIDEQLRAPDPKADQINVPANPQHYWRWRMNVSMQDLLKRDDLCATLKKLLIDSGRFEGY